MSKLINNIDKKIYKNQPFTDAYGQYNKGIVESGDNLKLLGRTQNNIANIESDLYTSVIHKEEIMSGHNTGLLWQTFGSKIQVTSCDIHDNHYYGGAWGGVDSAGGNYPGTQVAFYIFDSATKDGKDVETVFDAGNIGDGNKIRDAIGEGNGWNSSPHCIGYWFKGNHKHKTPLDNVITYVSEFTDVSVNDFPKKTTPGSTAVTFKNDFDTENFHNEITGKTPGAYYIVVRIGADEREKIWGSGASTDEINRHYQVAKIPKTALFQLWDENVDTTTISLDFFVDHGNNDDTFRRFEDDYGGSRGYGKFLGVYPTKNIRSPLFHVNTMSIQITGPTAWTPKAAYESINAAWVNSTSNAGWWCIDNNKADGERQGLNPNYDIDFIGWPGNFYYTVTNNIPDKGNYFQGELINQNNFRPISSISASNLNTSIGPTDIQSYYDDDTEIGFHLNNLISAPHDFDLSFRLAEKPSNIESTHITGQSSNDFEHWFFVINWEWKDGDLGGGSCEESPEVNACIKEVADDFPRDIYELASLNNEKDLFKIKEIGNNTTDAYSEVRDIATHQYNEPGLKIIKAIVFSTIDNSITEYTDYVQALQWKLVTIRANVTEDRGTISDFEDVGGNDFTYLPFPAVINSTLKSANDILYKSSHPVISGLSEESTYVKSLRSIVATNKFGKAEMAEKLKAKGAYENSPLGGYNEYGDFLGKSDIAQVRFFNTGSVDMSTLLDIDVAPDASTFNPHSSNYWDCTYWNTNRNDCFEESPVDDIFINDYSGFKEYCLAEFNFNELDGKTVRDSSGNGNKAILFGDFSIKKEDINKKTIRDSYIKTPKLGRKNGAI